MIGLISATAAGRRGCERLAAAWPDRTRRYDGPVREVLPAAFAECDQLVLFLATGAAVRLLAPLLTTKQADPAVVTVDEAHRHAIALLGGHASAANALAAALTPLLGTAPVITTATDAAGLPALDLLPYPAEGALPAVTRALLDGEPVTLRTDAVWPLPPLPLTPEPPAPAGVPAEPASPTAPAGTAPPTPATPLPTAAADQRDEPVPAFAGVPGVGDRSDGGRRCAHRGGAAALVGGRGRGESGGGGGGGCRAGGRESGGGGARGPECGRVGDGCREGR
ncbi:Cobalamin synthesis G N-terminal [Streptomyces sp. DvalAA-14]|nr:Cobalamin synthesis G N-terminal [Streptomyces sp. DvalAA-14]